MRRLSLSTKLFAAALPLIVAVGGLLALTVRSDLDEINRAESGAELGSVWAPLITALDAVETESAALSTVEAAAEGEIVVTRPVADTAVRRATDQAINDLRTSIEGLGAFEAASAHVTAGRSALSAARRNIDMATIAPTMTSDIDPVEAYGIASREFVAVGQLLPSEAGDAELGRQLLALVKLAEAKLHANDVIAGTSSWPNETTDNTPLVQARAAFASMLTTIGEFEAIAPDDWATTFRDSGFSTSLGRYSVQLTTVARAADAGRVETFDTAGFADVVGQGVDFQRSISQSIVERANDEAGATRSATLRRIGIILAAVLIGALIAWFITRSVTRRVKAVANSANRVATEQLPALVEALRDPRGKAVLPDIEPVDAKGGDDLADLAHAFNSMQETLIDVAHEQVEVLRRGVSDIFITMARRNRSLIDRQLSMLDEFEAGVDDPEVLSNYYQLDHLATRMRRNSESLLVLANAEPKRRRVKATEIDDVVRASIGEVEDYRRVEIQHLESLQVRGTVVADISHLLAELLDNATSFSPPGSAVRVGGRRAGDSYMLRIVDDGVGISPDRLGELNELLRDPPIVGLSVDSTLGMSVVSLLANKHNIQVTLSTGSPGLTVDVVLPSSLFGPMDAPVIAPATSFEPAQQPDEQIVAWNEHPDADFAPVPTEPAIDLADHVAPAPLVAPEPQHDPVPVAEVPEPQAAAPAPPTPTTPADWTKMSLDMSAFATREAAPDSAVHPADPAPVVASAADPASEPQPTEPTPATAAPVAAAMPAMPEMPAIPEVPEPPEVSAARVETAPESPNLPPPGRPHGEFDVPPAPPILPGALSHRPVTPDTARPAPVPAHSPDPAPALPTRTQKGSGPEGPDRLAGLSSDTGVPVAPSEPSALQAALAAFDNGRSAVNAQPAGELPTRDRLGERLDRIEETQSVTQSRVDPSALRDRLRAFQSEFTNANGSGNSGSDIYTDHNESQPDLGGDPR